MIVVDIGMFDIWYTMCIVYCVVEVWIMYLIVRFPHQEMKIVIVAKISERRIFLNIVKSIFQLWAPENRRAFFPIFIGFNSVAIR